MNNKQQVYNTAFSTTEVDKKSVLIVEDDQLTSDVLLASIKDAGLEVVAVTTIEMAWRKIRQSCPNLIVLDLGLPDGNGMTLAREVRAKYSSVGILVVTARTDAIDVVLGLELGVDDYVRKPFIAREVSARVHAILRRMQAPVMAQLQGGMKFGGWRLDIPERRLIDEQGNDIDLTRAEFDLLTHLVKSPGRVQSREQLLRIISNQADEVTDRTVDVIIGRLRRKIRDDLIHPAMILTVRGIGYRFVLNNQLASNHTIEPHA